jgi:hypothetical protein
MSSPISTGSHPKLLWPGIKDIWGRSYDTHGEQCKELFTFEGSEKAYEEIVEVTGFGVAPVKSEGASTVYDTETQGTVTRSTHVAYSLGYIVTKEEMDDNLYEEVSGTRAKANAFSMYTTKETVAANVYNRAFNSSYTFGDGKEICATDHPTLSGDQSNELATAADLSETSLEDMLIQIMNAKNSRGLRIALKGETLHVAPGNVFNAERILKSTLQNDTANNAINVVRNSGFLPGGLKVNNYFTDADAWFIRTNAPSGMTAYQRKAIEFGQDNDFDTDNAKAKAYERYSFTVGDFRGIYGTPGAA